MAHGGSERDLIAGGTQVTICSASEFAGPIFTLGIYMFWWYFNQMDKPNKHFASHWAHEDELVTAVEKFT
jgi:hypothetical protein